jgi:hypothetical protein
MALTFTNLTRANEIGANCYYLNFGRNGLLLDAGDHPKIEGALSKPALERSTASFTTPSTSWSSSGRS